MFSSISLHLDELFLFWRIKLEWNQVKVCGVTENFNVGVFFNKCFNNTSTANLNIAQLIASFSHKTYVTHGSYFTFENMFFICQKVLSQHWLMGFLTPSRTGYIGAAGVFLYPDMRYRSRPFKKKIFHPFTVPIIKFREKKYTLEAKKYNEPLPHPPIFLQPLTEWY